MSIYFIYKGSPRNESKKSPRNVNKINYSIILHGFLSLTFSRIVRFCYMFVRA